jgi:hypothetical protein
MCRDKHWSSRPPRHTMMNVCLAQHYGCPALHKLDLEWQTASAHHSRFCPAGRHTRQPLPGSWLRAVPSQSAAQQLAPINRPAPCQQLLWQLLSTPCRGHSSPEAKPRLRCRAWRPPQLRSATWRLPLCQLAALPHSRRRAASPASLPPRVQAPHQAVQSPPGCAAARYASLPPCSERGLLKSTL